MARNIGNILTKNYSGKIGDQLVMKQQNGNTLLTVYPDRSNLRLSPLQLKSNDVFREAVAYAKALIADPVRKAELRKKLKSRKKTAQKHPYQAAIQEFMLANSRPMRLAEADEILNRYQLDHPLTERQINGLKYLLLEQGLNNAVYQNLNKVSKATATRDLQHMVSRGIISTAGRGAGAKYSLVLTAREEEVEEE